MTRRNEPLRHRRAPLSLLQLEDRTVPSASASVFVIPPIGTIGGAIATDNDFIDTDGNNPVAISVLDNDQATTGFALVPSSVHVVTSPTRGGVTVDAKTGEITYTAVGFFQGTDTFKYTVQDTTGATSAPTNVTVVVNRPTANDDFATTTTNTAVAVDVLGNDTDPDGNGEIDPTSVNVTTPPQHGTLAVDSKTGVTTYTPASGFTGTDSWRYTITDFPGAVSFPARATVVVNPTTITPAAPTALDDVADTDGNNPVEVDVLANDAAASGHTLDPSTVKIVTPAQHGTLTVNPLTGAITYTSIGFNIGTDTYQYTVSDGTSTSAPATVSIVVNRPTANDDFMDTDGNNPVDVDVLANDSDPDGNSEINAASVHVISGPARGTVTVDPVTGHITYTATGFFEGTDTFQYTITDFPGAVSAPATVTIIIHRPQANPDSALTLGTAPVVIPVLDNDTDPDGNFEINPGSVNVTSGPAHGTVSIDSLTGNVTYTPTGNYIGVDSFRYTITDFPGAVSSPTDVQIKVEAAKASQFTAAGAGSGGGPAVTLFNTDGTVRASFFAFDQSFGGGVRVAVADVTGDGVPDIIAAPGPGGGPIVRVFDGSTLQMVASFFAYDPSFRGGITVAVGDINGDGKLDIITGTGDGGGPQVNIFDGATHQVVSSFFAFDGSFRGGVNVAVGDVNGDGKADIVTGAGVGGGPQVNVFSGADLSKLTSFFTFDPSFRGGVVVAVGDTTGDTFPEIIAAAGPGGGPQVLVLDQSGTVLKSFYAYAPTFTGGVQLATADVNQDGRADIVVAPGPGASLPVRTIDAETLAELHSSGAFNGFLGGVYVGG